MACEVRILPTAEREVADIVEYLAAQSSVAASSFVSSYQEMLELLGSGTVDFAPSRLPELAKLGYRACVAGSYVMLHYRDGDDAVIAHVFHGSRDYAWMVRPSGDGMSDT